MIRKLKQIVQRYEYVYMKESDLVQSSRREHEEIIRAVVTGDPRRAAGALRRHWESSMYALLQFLRSREKSVSHAGKSRQSYANVFQRRS
jgi:DNA-binding GntR family transcriptional regulator